MTTTTSVRLTPLESADSERLFEWINDRELVQLSSAFHAVSAEQHQTWFERVRRSSDPLIFAIRAGDPAALVGTCQLHSFDRTARSAELQIRIGDRSAWGQGVGTEAVRQLVAEGFNQQNLHRITLHVFADNLRAQRVYEKAGFSREACLRQHALVDGHAVDVILMARCRD